MLDTLYGELNNAIDAAEPTQIWVGTDRFGYIRDGLGYRGGKHGYREWWAVEHCVRFLKRQGVIKEFAYLSINEIADYLEITPVKKRNRKTPHVVV